MTTPTSRPSPTNRRRRGARRAAVALALAGGLLAGCGTSTPSATVGQAAEVLPAGAHIVHPGPPKATPGCTDPTRSIAPPTVMPQPGAMPAGSWMATIQARGSLVVGVDQNTYLWGYRDPQTAAWTGFDIDMLRQISRAIFGTPDAITFRVVPTADRQYAVDSGEVDIVAETMTVNCAREHTDPYTVDFSSVYFEAGQQILVPSNSTITGQQDLAGKRVCATDGSTSLEHLATLAGPSGRPLSPPPVLWSVPSDTDCLVMMQQGQVDAISTDNTILQGLKAQDPNTAIVGQPFTQEPYGMAIAKSHPEFTSFVNGVLAAELADGTWAQLFAKDLAPFTGGQAPTLPPARYRGGP